MIKIILFCVTSVLFGSSLNDWIENKSELIKNNNFKVSFNYTIKDKKEKNQENMYQNIEYYSINQSEQVLKIDNRYVLFYPDYSEVIDELRCTYVKISLKATFHHCSFWIYKFAPKLLMSVSSRHWCCKR